MTAGFAEGTIPVSEETTRSASHSPLKHGDLTEERGWIIHLLRRARALQNGRAGIVRTTFEEAEGLAPTRGVRAGSISARGGIQVGVLERGCHAVNIELADPERRRLSPPRGGRSSNFAGDPARFFSAEFEVVGNA